MVILTSNQKSQSIVRKPRSGSGVLSREQYYMDLLQPEQNILKIAGSSLGYKHTEEDKLKIKEAHRSDEQKDRVSKIYLQHTKESREKL